MTSGGTGDDSSVCVRRILSVGDMNRWFKSQGYKDISTFIKQLNEFAKGVHNGLNDADTIKEPCLIRVKNFLDELMVLADQIKPIQGDKGQRFGNKAFRTWFDEMKKKMLTMLETHYSLEDRNELRPYLEESFGNKHRIDYGTGHELSFIIFLMGLYKLQMMEGETGNQQHQPQPSKERMKAFSQEILTLFAVKYMPLCRKIQLIYQLEPAGSHGVYSLDDFQFLPFLFGSSQLIAHPLLEPKNFPDQKVAEDNASRYMFFAAIHFIHQVKKGPFPEHSNQLWNISGVENWSKINRGLLKMYTDEVLNKFPIVQHLVFGPRILIWTPAS